MKRESKAVKNKKKRINLIKKAYFTIRENIVTTVVCLVVLACAASFVIIITSDTSTSSDKSYETQTIKKIDQRFAISSIRSLNPISSTDKDTYYMSKLLFSSLFAYDNNLSLTPELVDDYSVNTSNGTIDLTLKSGIKFSNGESLSGVDVEYTVERIKEDGKDAPFYEMGDKIKSVESNGREVSIAFKKPDDASLNNLTFPILCETGYSTDSDYTPIGTGQYQVYSADFDRKIILEPNKSYFGTVAKNDLYFQMFPKSTQTQSLIGSYDVTSLFYDKFDGRSIAEDKKLDCTQITSNNLDYMAFNFKNELLKEKKFRQAIAYSIDLDKLVSSAYSEIANPVDSVYFPNYLGVENKGDSYPVNFNKSESLINELGLEDSDKDGYLEDKQGNNIRLNILVNSNAPNRCMAAEKLAEYLEGIQIQAKVFDENWDDYIADIKKRDFDILLGGYSIDKNDNLAFLFNKDNYIAYNNKQILKDVNKLNTIMKIEDYKELYGKIKNEIIDDLPYYPICYRNYSLLGVKNSSYEILPSFDNVYGGVSTWSYEQEVRVEKDD